MGGIIRRLVTTFLVSTTALAGIAASAGTASATTGLVGWYATNWSAQCHPNGSAPANSYVLSTAPVSFVGVFGRFQVPACGPKPGNSGTSVYVAGSAQAFTPGWQCVELVERYLYWRTASPRWRR